MNRLLSASLACALMLAIQGPVLAQRAGGGGHPSGGGGGARPSMPMRPAAPPRPVTAPRQPAPGGFNLPRDVNGRPAPAVRSNVPRAAYPAIAHLRPGPVVYPAGRRGPRPPWGWNNGVVWYPVPIYWGGGFWGPWAFGATLVLWGSIIDYQDQVIYPSYQIAPSSPGAQLLEDYGLQQTQCGPPNLVVIWGPDNSVICAYPNHLVSAGNYQLDPATLTIQTLQPPQ